MTKLIEITGKALSGEWGCDDETGKGIPVLRTTNFSNDGTVNYDNVVTRIIIKKNLDEKFLQQGDILIEKSGGSDKQPVGRVIFFDGPEKIYLFNNFTGLLRVKNTVKWYPRYVFYALFANYLQGGTRTFENKTTGLHNLKIDDYVAQFMIKETPMQNQLTICGLLDKTRGVITLCRQQIQKFDDLIRARFVEMFGSQCHNEKQFTYGKIDDVAEIYLGLTHTPKYIETGVKFISAKNTSGDYLDLKDVKYISKEEYLSAPNGAKPRKGDVLFSRVGSNLGHPVILDIEEELCTFVSLGFLRTKGAVTNLYLKHWMRDDFFTEQVRRKVVGGGQPNLNTGWLKEFGIIIPPTELQDQSAAFVEQVDKSKLAVQQSLDKTQELFDSLMQKYFG